jgi:hypothetical protein
MNFPLTSKTREEIPTPPFDFYMIWHNNKLTKGTAGGVHWFTDPELSLLGTPTKVKYEEDPNDPLDPIQRNSIPYLVNLKLTPQEALEERIRALNQSNEYNTKNIERALRDVKNTITHCSIAIDQNNKFIKECEGALALYNTTNPL